MPIYEYQCTACGKKLEEMQRISDKPLRKCPSCGENKLKKALSLGGFQLKGSGWYKDGYSSPKTSSAASSTLPTAAATTTPAPSTEKKSAKKESKATT